MQVDICPNPNGVWVLRMLVGENRLTPALVSSLDGAIQRAVDSDAKAIILTGEGKFFCNGHDVDALGDVATLWVAHPRPSPDPPL